VKDAIWIMTAEKSAGTHAIFVQIEGTSFPIGVTCVQIPGNSDRIGEKAVRPRNCARNVATSFVIEGF
jgi:hypothetical protein